MGMFLLDPNFRTSARASDSVSDGVILIFARPNQIVAENAGPKERERKGEKKQNKLFLDNFSF